MSSKYHLTIHATSDEETEKLLFDGLNQYGKETKGMNPIELFAISVQDEAGHIVGGAKGQTYYGCLYVDILWISKEHRHHGLGTLLMQKAESLGKAKDCTFATVNTMDWEALGFYQKQGYQIEFVRSGYLLDSKMYFLRKSLKR